VARAVANDAIAQGGTDREFTLKKKVSAPNKIYIIDPHKRKFNIQF